MTNKIKIFVDPNTPKSELKKLARVAQKEIKDALSQSGRQANETRYSFCELCERINNAGYICRYEKDSKFETANN